MSKTAEQIVKTKPASPAPIPVGDTGAKLLFMKGFQQWADGEPVQGGKLQIDFEPERLATCHMKHGGKSGWNLVGYTRFLPGGEMYTDSLLDLKSEPPSAKSMTVPVPDNATQVELWFNNTDFTGCSVWDSRYGANYVYNVRPKGPPSPSNPVIRRYGSITDLSMVNVISNSAITKPNQGADETVLQILAWVNNVTYVKYVYADIHVFDDSDHVIVAESVSLEYAQPAGGGGDFFDLDNVVYRRTLNRPLAKKAQYRVYYEVNGQVFTDGVLHTLAIK